MERMRTVHEIEAAIARLSSIELSQLREWFIDLDASQWDAEIERDALAGRLDAIAGEAIANFRSGKCTP